MRHPDSEYIPSTTNPQVDTVFGYPGGAILPVFDGIYNSKDFNLVLPRHEQGAGHMAEGYARASGLVSATPVTGWLPR